MASEFLKDPDSVLDYPVVWHLWLGSDTISSHTAIADSGITIDSSSVNGGDVVIGGVTYPADTVVTMWISGGTVDTDYEIDVTIVTTNATSRTASRKIIIRVRDR